MARRERVWIGCAVLIGMWLGFLWALWSPNGAVMARRRISVREYGIFGYYSVTNMVIEDFTGGTRFTVFKQVDPDGLTFTLLATFALTACCCGCVCLDWTKWCEPDRNPQPSQVAFGQRGSRRPGPS